MLKLKNVSELLCVCVILLSIIVIAMGLVAHQTFIVECWMFIFITQGILLYISAITESTTVNLEYLSIFCKSIIIIGAILNIVNLFHVLNL